MFHMGNNACAEIYGYKTVGADIIRPSVSLQLAVSLVGDDALDVPSANLKLAASLFWDGWLHLLDRYFLRGVRKTWLRPSYCFFRGTLSPSFTLCQRVVNPLDSRCLAASPLFYFFFFVSVFSFLIQCLLQRFPCRLNNSVRTERRSRTSINSIRTYLSTDLRQYCIPCVAEILRIIIIRPSSN